jgi:Tol biopolymer transport system component
MSPDGRRLFFISNRPIIGDTARTDFDLWVVDRKPNGGWGSPRHAGDEVNGPANLAYPSASSDGTLYYQQGPAILRAPLLSTGEYGPGEPVVLGDGQGRFFAPAVSPSGTMLFVIGPGTSQRDGGDLYVSFRTGDAWTRPKRLATPVNSVFSETAPSVSADGKTLYFSSERVSRTGLVWPRRRRLQTLAEVQDELSRVTLNGLRNIYSVDISALNDATKR